MGSITIHRVAEITLSFPAGLIFPAATSELVARGRQWLDGRFIAADTDSVMMGFHSFVIRTGTRTILVDTCHGNHKVRRAPVDHANDLNTDYLANLDKAGFRPDDIDMVLCTHLHMDHVGWNTRLRDGQWVPTFPNARYLMSHDDYEHFDHDHRLPGSVEADAFQDSVVPIVRAGRADFIDTGHVIERELGNDIWIEGAAGHTPGSITLNATTPAGKAVFAGDVIHHPLQIMEPTLHVVSDWDVAMATATRRSLLESCADQDTTLMTAHFPDPTAGRVISTADGFRFAFAHE